MSPFYICTVIKYMLKTQILLRFVSGTLKVSVCRYVKYNLIMNNN